MKFEELKRLIEGKEELAKKPLSEVKIKKVSGIPIIEGVTTVGDLIPKEMKEEDLKPFLRETELCDYNHPKIKGWVFLKLSKAIHPFLGKCLLHYRMFCNPVVGYIIFPPSKRYPGLQLCLLDSFKSFPTPKLSQPIQQL